jgi:hypothetical protein
VQARDADEDEWVRAPEAPVDARAGKRAKSKRRWIRNAGEEP